MLEQERPTSYIHSRVPGWIPWLAWRKLDLPTPALVSTVHGFYSVNAYSAIMTRGERVIAVSSASGITWNASFPNPKAALCLVRHGIDPTQTTCGFQPDAAWLAQWQRDFPSSPASNCCCCPDASRA